MNKRNYLKWSLAGLMIVFGIDKYFNVLGDWPRYVPDFLPGLVHMSPQTIMWIVGILEIASGLIALAIPLIGGYVLAAGFAGIAITLVLHRGDYNLAIINAILSGYGVILARMSGDKKDPH